MEFGQNDYRAYKSIMLGAISGQVFVSATVLDENGTDLNDLIVFYSLAEPYEGVTINRTTGLVTIDPSAPVGSVVVIAAYEGLSAEATLPQQVNTLTHVTAIALGSSFSLALREDGTVCAWGSNYYGQLGDNSTTSHETPSPVSVLRDIAAIASGDNYSVAAKDSKTTWAWGRNNGGQLGDGTTINRNMPAYSLLPAEATLVCFVNEGYQAEIRVDRDATVSVNACVLDQRGHTMENTEIFYTLAEPYEGVSIDEVLGMVTIASTADAGVVMIRAICETVVAEVELTLLPTSAHSELSIGTNAGAIYNISVSAEDFESFSWGMIKLTYDETVLELVDLCALTLEIESGIGIVEDVGVAICAIKPGEILFTVDKQVPEGYLWSGVINIFQFIGLTSDITHVVINIEK